jgi:hypothetical protein
LRPADRRHELGCSPHDDGGEEQHRRGCKSLRSEKRQETCAGQNERDDGHGFQRLSQELQRANPAEAKVNREGNCDVALDGEQEEAQPGKERPADHHRWVSHEDCEGDRCGHPQRSGRNAEAKQPGKYVPARFPSRHRELANADRRETHVAQAAGYAYERSHREIAASVDNAKMPHEYGRRAQCHAQSECVAADPDQPAASNSRADPWRV